MILDDDDQTSGKIHLRFYFSLFSSFFFFHHRRKHTHFLFEKKTTILLCTYIHNACFLSSFSFKCHWKSFLLLLPRNVFFLDSNNFFLIFVWCGPLQMSFFLHQTQYGTSHRQFPCEKKENPHDDHIFIIFEKEYAHTNKNHVFFNIINALGYERQTYWCQKMFHDKWCWALFFFSCFGLLLVGW